MQSQIVTGFEFIGQQHQIHVGIRSIGPVVEIESEWQSDIGDSPQQPKHYSVETITQSD